MYLHQIRLVNIKCFKNLDLNFTEEQSGKKAKTRQMTVILGDNGLGKTVLLQTIALALGGKKVGKTFLRGRWHRVGSKRGYIQATIYPHQSRSEKDSQPLEATYSLSEGLPRRYNSLETPSIFVKPDSNLERLKKTAYTNHALGWLACGYGARRHLTHYPLSQLQDTKTSRFASLFGDAEQLVPLENWLFELNRRAILEEQSGRTSKYRQIFNQLAWTLLQILPPDHMGLIKISTAKKRTIDPSAYIKVDPSQGVLWQDSLGHWVSPSHLSNSYQSMMSWTADLVSRLSTAFPRSEDFLEQRGIVLIDEIDLHLHPTWQRNVLNQLRHAFPKIQFIVTTHSPLIAAGARAGELFTLKPTTQGVALETGKTVQGWRADQILTSDLFGMETTLDLETTRQLARYDELLTLQASSKLNQKQTQELSALEDILGQKLPPPGESPEQSQLYQEVEDFIVRWEKL